MLTLPGMAAPAALNPCTLTHPRAADARGVSSGACGSSCSVGGTRPAMADEVLKREREETLPSLMPPRSWEGAWPRL
eukprot:1156000-Pelagomonas_calceolata.AAC.4